MPQLNLNLTLQLSDDEAAAIADALGCSVADLAQHLGPYAPAALREYAEMLAGQAMTSVTDLRERRLVAMLLALPDIPSDERIARLFNLTSAQGRALLRTTLSRHRNRLKSTMDVAARRFIAACQGAPGAEREARFPNAVVVDMLNAQLAAASAPRSPIRRKAGTFDTYVVSNGAFIELQALYP
ncbi:hypothetical protein ACFQRC_04460 [Enterovirga sp. GCM10030262]|uniref:hypothetical protein n=1 Tax=Enterovirga sp. GCM10030262 TaxID=3273391 RepID=UPI00361DE117